MSDFTKEYWPSDEPDFFERVHKVGDAGPARNVDPLLVTPSALAHGQIGHVPWALVARGDGLVLAIGDLNVPIDTAKEAVAAMDLADALQLYGARIAWNLTP